MSQELQNRIYSNNFADIILPYTYTTPERFLEYFQRNYPQIINDTYAFIHVPIQENSAEDPSKFLSSVVPQLYVPLDYTSLENTGILAAQSQPFLNLTGNGVLLGFVDTGILYTHPSFQNPGKRTRIVRIWDQTIPTENGSGPFSYGTEYTQEQINLALQNEKPLSIVPSTDTNGHGTFVAGVAAGSSAPLAEFIGVAPQASIAVVKLKEAKQHLKEFYFFSGDVPVYQETDIIAAVQYLVQLSRDLSMPLVLCLALGSNQGDHAGNTPLEFSLGRTSFIPGVVSVCAAGNEGNQDHHFYGTMTQDEEPVVVEINVPEHCDGFFMELWGDVPALYSVGIRSPLGESVPRIPARIGQTEVIRFLLQETVVYVTYELVQSTSGSQLILLRFRDPTPGIWNLDVYFSNASTGSFHIWLPIDGFLKEDVRFLNPDPYTTTTQPGNSTNAITPSTYNAANQSLYLYSSRGYTRTNQFKPDFAAPGVDVTGPDLRGQYTTRSGSSISTAITAGSAALLLEWGIKLRPYQYFSTYEIKNYFIRGARQMPGLTYPNREWGYGALNLYQIFTSLTNT